MSMTEQASTGSLHKELARIQRDLIAPRGQKNPHLKSNYRNAEDILSALRHVQGDCAITMETELQELAGQVYFWAIATISLGGESISVRAPAAESTGKNRDPSQNSGSALSYARKYALGGLFCVDNTKDADSMAPPAQEADPSIKRKLWVQSVLGADRCKAVAAEHGPAKALEILEAEAKAKAPQLNT